MYFWLDDSQTNRSFDRMLNLSDVWLQSGIRNDAAAETLAKAGIKVVQDRCIMVDHRYL